MNYDSVQMIVQLVISLAVVIGMMWLLVKFLQLRSKWLTGHQPLKVIGAVGVGPQKTIQLVEIGDVLYVLGIGQDVTLLRVIDDPEELERIKEDFTGTRDNTRFSWLERFRARREQPPQTDFTAVLEDKLVEVRKQREQSLGEWLVEKNRSPQKEQGD